MTRPTDNALLIAALLGTVLACHGVAQATGQRVSAAMSGTDSVALKEQTETVLAGFDELSSAITEGNNAASLERLDTLRRSIESLNDFVTTSASPQTQPLLGKVKGQQVARPAGPVTTSDEPPTADEVAAMERAVGLTHLPGPPLKDAGEVEVAVPLSFRVEQATLEALSLLDQIELAIGNQQHDTARAVQRRARNVIEDLESSFR